LGRSGSGSACRVGRGGFGGRGGARCGPGLVRGLEEPFGFLARLVGVGGGVARREGHVDGGLVIERQRGIHLVVGVRRRGERHLGLARYGRAGARAAGALGLGLLGRGSLGRGGLGVGLARAGPALGRGRLLGGGGSLRRLLDGGLAGAGAAAGRRRLGDRGLLRRGGLGGLAHGLGLGGGRLDRRGLRGLGGLVGVVLLVVLLAGHHFAGLEVATLAVAPATAAAALLARPVILLGGAGGRGRRHGVISLLDGLHGLGRLLLDELLLVGHQVRAAGDDDGAGVGDGAGRGLERSMAKSGETSFTSASTRTAMP
jgi:hypothetical protein